MTIRVKTNGETLRAYVGGTRVPVDPDGRLDPIETALAQLRVDCENDRRKLMGQFRWHVEKRSDVFGRKEAQWQAYLSHVHEQVQARKAAEPPPPAPNWVYESVTITSQKDYA